jgi:hypothetical protein
MWTIRVEATEVTIHSFITYTTDILELHSIATEVNDICDEVVFGLIYKFRHTETVAHFFIYERLLCSLRHPIHSRPFLGRSRYPTMARS